MCVRMTWKGSWLPGAKATSSLFPRRLQSAGETPSQPPEDEREREREAGRTHHWADFVVSWTSIFRVLTDRWSCGGPGEGRPEVVHRAPASCTANCLSVAT